MTTRRSVPPPGRFAPPFAVDAGTGVPIHRQIFDWFQAAVVEGRLQPGQDVPSTRGLAAELGVSRAPVLAAFDQLIAEGYFVATVGAGTRVSRSIPQPLAFAPGKALPDTQAGDRQPSTRAAALALAEAPWLRHAGAFRPGPPALDHFPVAEWGAIAARHARSGSAGLLGYGSPMGHRPLRDAIAAYLGAARGVRCTADDIMIVSGSQQGLQIAARALLDAGDAVLMEEPGYPGAHAAFVSAGLNVVPVPLDAEGLDIAAGAVRAPQARAAYVTPSHQYPLGLGMGAARRLALLRWAADHRAWVVEDDYDSEFRFGARPVMALQGLDAAGRTVYLGTFSKVMFPALRVGYLVVPPGMRTAFTGVRDALDIFPPTLIQAALASFIAEGHFARHLRRMRLLYQRRRARLVDALAARLGNRLRVAGIRAGMHVTALLPDDADDVAVAVRAAGAGLSVIPLSTCCLERPMRGLVLGYGNVDEAAIDRGVAILGGLLDG